MPFTFDPAGTNLVAALWNTGLGCPTGATSTAGPVNDPACLTGDLKDKRNEGLLPAKTGPTGNVAAAGARLLGVKGIKLTELGYDLRKSLNQTTPNGSHCGAGAPRFNVTTDDGVTHFVGCNSPPGVVVSASNAWIRLRWTVAQLAAAFPPILPTQTVTSITIIFDEGTDTGPDFFGAAVLDNIDVNGNLVGRGPRGGQ